MKLRTRFMAMVLTILLAVETPVTAFAGTGAGLSADPAVNGEVVVVNEDGTQQVLTGEDLANGAGLPENITVTGGGEAAVGGEVEVVEVGLAGAGFADEAGAVVGGSVVDEEDAGGEEGGGEEGGEFVLEAGDVAFFVVDWYYDG